MLKKGVENIEIESHPAYILRCNKLMFQGWKWVVIALTVFVVDFAVRLCRRNKSSFQVSKVIHLPGEVTQFTLTTSHTFLLKPGQVIM